MDKVLKQDSSNHSKQPTQSSAESISIICRYDACFICCDFFKFLVGTYLTRAGHSGSASEVKALIVWTLTSWVRISLKAWMFVLVFLCCFILCRLKRLPRADHSSKGVLPSVKIDYQNLPCEATKILIRIVQPMMNEWVNVINTLLSTAEAWSRPFALNQCQGQEWEWSTPLFLPSASTERTGTAILHILKHSETHLLYLY
jgi:hypothetical protein